MDFIAAIGVALGAGLLWLYVKSKDSSTITTGENMSLGDQLRATNIPEHAKQYADDIATGAVSSLPNDYDEGILSWALLITAVGEYESGYGNDRGYSPHGDPQGWGDNGNAFGFWQVDKHYHAKFIYGDDTSVAAQAAYAGSVLAKAWGYFSGYQERKALAIAGYNASANRIRNMVDNGASFTEVDATTTQRSGHGYATGVINYADSYA